MNTYSTYNETDTGPPISVPPTQDEAFLPHTYYVGIVLSELATMDSTEYNMSITDIRDRLDHLISYIHGDISVQTVVRSYFDNSECIHDVLYSLEDSGLLRLYEDHIEMTASQLDYIREYLLQYL